MLVTELGPQALLFFELRVLVADEGGQLLDLDFVGVPVETDFVS